ncbi:MAG TPA: glucose-1-phosphate adenylyltransferase [Pirellulales bacterium]
MRKVMTVILAGGRGTRLDPLTRDRAKPAVPFGGVYRIIDFALSNCINSGLRRVLITTQYKGMSLQRHIDLGWRFLCRELDEFIDTVPPQQWIDEHWYQGTADAIYQNIHLIEPCCPEELLILGGDHVYKMDYSRMIAAHREAGADATIGVLPVSLSEATEFGIVETNAARRVIGFDEKPRHPKPMPGSSDQALASMGIYVFNTKFLFERLRQNASDGAAKHDFGKDVLPSIIDTHNVLAYPFRDENGKAHAYWRDVGTLDAYFEANMDLASVDPQFNLYDYRWPIRTYMPNYPPPKFVFDSPDRRGQAVDSLVGPGTIISGGRVARSVVGMNARVHSYADVEDSILFEGVDVGRHAKIRRAIIDKNVRVPPYCRIGCNREEDLARGFTISDNGIVVVPKGHTLEETRRPTRAASSLPDGFSK